MTGTSAYTLNTCTNGRGYLNRLAKRFKKEGVPLSELVLDLAPNPLNRKEKQIQQSFVDIQRLSKRYRVTRIR